MQHDRPLKRAREGQEEDDGIADQGRTKTEFDLAEAERRESQNINSFADAIWSQSQSYHRRSQYRSQLGRHSEALSDARKALQLFPENARYLLRTAEALAASGYPRKAVKAVRQLHQAIAITPQEDANELEEACFQLQRRISPVSCLPDEIVGDILQMVNEDWKSLKSPFTVAHISSRWRRIALSKQSLWRDLRILRCARRICLDIADPRESRLRDPTILKATESFLAMTRFCDKYSNHTLTHFEMAALDREMGLAQAALYIVAPSAQTLRRLRIVDTWGYIFSSNDSSHIVDYFDSDSSSEEGNFQYHTRMSTSHEHSSFCLRALRLALQASNVKSLELCLLGLEKEHEPLFEAHLDSAPLRQTWPLHLTLSGFPFSCGFQPRTESANLPRTRSFFASLGSSATALRLWTPHLSAEGFERGFEPDDTLAALLPAAASTLCDLELSSWWLNTSAFRDQVYQFSALESLQLLDADLLTAERWGGPINVQWPGRATLPKLREADGFLQAFLHFADDQLRHAVLHCNPARDLERLRNLQRSTALQSLEHLHVIISSDFHSVDDESEFVEALFSWLLDDVAVVDQESHRTPCSNLKAFHLSRWDGSKPYDEEPSSRQHWEARCQVSSFIGKLERNRRLGSQGLRSLPNKEQVKPTAVAAAFRRGPQKSTDSPSIASIPAITHPPSCVALEKIALSGCHIDTAVWAALQASPCEVTCDVDPFKMEKLPYAVEKRNRSRRTLGL